MMKRIYILAVALVLALMPAAAQDVSKHTAATEQANSDAIITHSRGLR